MAAHLLRLRLDLLLGALRGDARHVTRVLLALLALIVVVAGVVIGTLRLQTAGVDVAAAVTIVAGSALTLGVFAAAFMGGIDDQLDPRRFAVFGLSPLSVAGSTFAAGILSLPVLALIVVAVAVGRLWVGLGASVALTIVAAVLGALTCALTAKVALAFAGLVLPGRRSRELAGVFLVAVLVVVIPTALFFVSLEWNGQVPSALREAVEVLSVTPLGAAWAIPAASLSGSLTGPLLVAIATVLGLGALWVWLVHRLLTTAERPVVARERGGLGWFALTPSTPAGGIAARSLIYWLRDPRYIVNLAIVPVVAVVVIVPLLIVGVPPAYVALIPAPLMALFFGWIAHNDLAYDSTALWMHVASAVRGASDRIGRLVPVLLVGLASLAVVVPLTVSLHGRWAILPAMAGVCASLFLSGLGLSSLASVVSPYAVSRPGDSPFQQPQRTHGGLSQGVVLVGALVLSVPALWWGWRAVAVDVDETWPALWAGLAIGLVVLIIGVVAGGAVFERRGGRLMEFAEST